MKRIGNIYEQLTSLKNIQEADAKAQVGKRNQYGVVLHNQNREGNLLILQDMLASKTYRTSTYDIFNTDTTEATLAGERGLLKSGFVKPPFSEPVKTIKDPSASEAVGWLGVPMEILGLARTSLSDAYNQLRR